MKYNKITDYIKEVLENMPEDWLKLTTHRLDIYDEQLAKTQFLERFELLYKDKNSDPNALRDLPTSYDYIRLGHPLSCILEWAIAQLYNHPADNVISFQSKMAPLLAILRNNLLQHNHTLIFYTGELPEYFDVQLLQNVYGYKLEIQKIDDTDAILKFEASTVFLSEQADLADFKIINNIDFFINTKEDLGSILLVNGQENKSCISDIQHFRRRETIAMTPANCLAVLQCLIQSPAQEDRVTVMDDSKSKVMAGIKKITGTGSDPLVASSGLSMQYAIMMGLIHDAQENHAGKAIRFIVPPNCYGGTNDQARRVAACVENVEVVDLPVDGENDMVESLAEVLDRIAMEDAVPYIIAEIPTNPRVEVPDLQKLKEILTASRKTSNGEVAIDPVFILDQTFCPNVHFLGEGEILSTVRAISYASGSKFPSGGRCTAGYCVANSKAAALLPKIDLHLHLCDNEATPLQYQILAEQLPSMNQRILEAYKNTRQFVNFIKETLPQAKINFVSEELAQQGFMPSVFSLDLPTKGNTPEEKESYKRELNHKLINLMITEIPHESKYCVSYGQLTGVYWTIPATSTQGTTAEGDKDYIARVALSPTMDLEMHKKVFAAFAAEI